MSHPTPIDQRPAWAALAEHARQMRQVHLKTLFHEAATTGEPRYPRFCRRASASRAS